jgi:hypothetical protein
MFASDNDSLSPARRHTGTALIALTGSILAASSVTKFVGLTPVVHQLEGFGFTGKIILLGIIEATTAALFLVPRTRSFGLLFISSFMGGAIATHLQHSQLPAPPAIVLGLAWFGVWLRHPAAFWSFAPTNRVAGIVGRDSEPAPATPSVRSHRLAETSRRVSQVVLGLAALLLLMIARKYIFDPAGAATSSGIALASRLGVTNTRAGVGGFALGCAIFAALCISGPRLAMNGLWFLITVVGSVFVVRVFGILNDGTATQSEPVLIAEAVLLALIAGALALGRAARSHPAAARPNRAIHG